VIVVSSKKNVDSIKIERAVLIGFLILISVLLGRTAIVQQNVLIGLIIPIVAICSWLWGRPIILFLVLLWVDAAALVIPGLPHTLGIPQLLQVVWIAWIVLDSTIKKQPYPYSANSTQDVWLIVFGLNLLLIMSIRGAGFALLGSTNYGGTSYLMVFVLILFFFSAIRIRIDQKYIKYLIWVVAIGAIIPVVAQLLVYFYEMKVWVLTKFINIGAVNLVEAKYMDDKIERFSSFRWLAASLIPLTYVIYTKKNVRLLLITVAFALIIMTGFRSLLVQTGIMVLACSIYFSRQRMKTLLFWGSLGLFGFIALLFITPDLSPSMQRTVSFIPFLQVDSEVALRAQGSTDFRVDMWKDYCIPAISDYLWIGRGMASEIMEFAWLQASWYGSAEFFYHMHRYHSGPFSLLLDFGLVGTISFTLFFLLAIFDGIRTLRAYAIGRTDLLSKYYGYLVVLASYQLFHFFFIFGDVQAKLYPMLMVVIQLRVLKKNFIMDRIESIDAESPELEEDTFRSPRVIR